MQGFQLWKYHKYAYRALQNVLAPATESPKQQKSSDLAFFLGRNSAFILIVTKTYLCGYDRDHSGLLE